MQNGRSVLMVCGVFWIFLVLSFSRAHGEILIRWTDDAGRPCYSNVSPPAGMKAFSVDTVSQSASDRSSPTQASVDTKTAKKMSVKTDGTYSEFSAAFLKQRITDLKRCIGHIEALLRRHPNDSALRKSLFKKKQYLFEDLTRLKNDRP